MADSNLIAYLLIPGDRNKVSEEVLCRDSHWAVPLLWRSEFRNILTLYMRHEGMVIEQAKITMSKAERLVSDREYAVNSEAVLDFVQKTALSAYDAEFVVLAQHFNTKVVTTDLKLLKEAPDRAVSPEGFLGIEC
ncbi:MAG: type II toxin-antitoxin system VapC family toxin [Deltaproteobacteria bacterium]|nr:type II toxin-antitoxin system VapC family toxin [Deltaproteobacteria bacterium]